VTELPTDTATTLEEIPLPPQARPISMLSWDQGSFVEPSPPYAVSLHEYTRGYSVEPSSFTTQQTFSKTPKARLFGGTREYKLVVAGADGIVSLYIKFIMARAQIEQFEQEHEASLCRGNSRFSIPPLRGEYNPFLPPER
jgi:hypothetical protein